MPRPSVADALLRLSMLAQVGIAGLHGWLAWRMRDWPADLPGPQPWRPAQVAGFMALCVLAPAAVVAWQRWHRSRDRRLAGLGLGYGLASAATLAGWASAVDAGTMLALHGLDAAIALAGIAVAVRALRV
jgi:hypothetical protein